MGQKRGPAVSFIWTPVSLLPHVLPWLALLALLALPQNRTPGAWWVWAAVAAELALEALLRAAEPFLNGQPIEMLVTAVSALSFSLASAWLLLRNKERNNRFVAFLLLLLLVGGLGAAAYELGALESASEGYQRVFELVLVEMCALVVCVALTVGGVLCRRRYRPALLLAWTLACTLVASFLVVLPFLVFALLQNGGNMAWGEFLAATVLLAVLCFAILVPFLALAFWNQLFRERLKSILRFTGTETPSMLTPVHPLEMNVR